MNHYNGMKDRVRPKALVIPDEFIVKPEDKHLDEDSQTAVIRFLH